VKLPRLVPPRRLLIGVAAGLWIAAVTVGFGVLASYASTAGDAGRHAARWPAGSRLARATDRPTLVVITQAYCPCSRATMTELGEIVGRVGDALRVHVIMTVPPQAAGDPRQTAIATAARNMPGVRLTVDEGHHEADLFGARTSGHTVLYDRAGRVIFSGGITGARGHSGGNEGRASILALIRGEPGSHSTPVFGCPTTKGTGT
jgi:hypothetical protein